MNTIEQQNSDWNTKPGENNKSNEGSDTTVSHEKENDSSSHSNEEHRGGRGRGRGRGGFRGNRGRGKNFTNNESHFSSNNVEIPDNASPNLFVKGINYEANEDDLKEIFGKYGEVTSCKILKDKETKKSKGIGFVNYADKKSKEEISKCVSLKIKKENLKERSRSIITEKRMAIIEEEAVEEEEALEEMIIEEEVIEEEIEEEEDLEEEIEIMKEIMIEMIGIIAITIIIKKMMGVGDLIIEKEVEAKKKMIMLGKCDIYYPLLKLVLMILFGFDCYSSLFFSFLIIFFNYI